MKRIKNFLFSRMFTIGFVLLLELVFIFFTVIKTSQTIPVFYFLMMAISIILIIRIFCLEINPAYKLVWTILIMGFLPFGCVLYLFWGNKRMSPKTRKRFLAANQKEREHYRQDPAILEELKNKDIQAAIQAEYIKRSAGSPIYKNTQSQYFKSGEAMLPALLEELEKAEKFIFIEFFIVNKGKMFDAVYEILVRKAKQGVDVRFLYDDIGTIRLLPGNFDQKMEADGIKTMVFNKLSPSLYIFINHRDHRKICVIDGNVGFTGGLNLADEYINEHERYGYWKDTAVMLKGEAVWSMTVAFLAMWHFAGGEMLCFDKYRPTRFPQNCAGYVQPYGDSPLDDLNVSENVYINIVSRAEKYVYITTPYLVLDNELLTALCMAAKGGVDVRIITPHIYDKWYVHFVTQSNYKVLVNAGVKIYEFTPGFIHSKMFVSDDKIAIVGSANLDYRSLYLHFEFCCLMMYSPTVGEIKSDILDTISQSEEITAGKIEKIKWYKRTIMSILKIFAPFM